MDGRSIFTTLRDILAKLYTDKNRANVIVFDAGLDALKIDFSGSAQTNWQHILIQAVQIGKLGSVLDRALADYDSNQELRLIYETYRSFISQGGHIDLPDQPLSDFETRLRPPLQRPPRAEHFVGRDKELNQLIHDLQPGKVVTICGPGGIGKTALAAEVVWRLASSDKAPTLFPDGIVFHSFYNQPQADLALEQIALSYNMEPRPTAAAAAQRALSGRRALIILDGAEAADNLQAVLLVRNRCTILVTSRRKSDAESSLLVLNPLLEEQSIKLLQAWGHDQTTEQTTAHQICTLIGHLPLAIRLVGRYLSQQGLDAREYLTWLNESLSALDLGTHEQDSIPLLLERTCTRLTTQAQTVMEVVSLLALAPFEQAVIIAATDLPQHEIIRSLGELMNYGLLNRIEREYTVSHALIHTYISQANVPSAAAFERLIGYITTFVNEHQNESTSLGKMRFHILRLLDGSIQRKLWKATIDLADAMDGYLDLQGYWNDLIKLTKAKLEAAKNAEERKVEATALGVLGSAYYNLGHCTEAIDFFQSALKVAEDIEDHRSEGIWQGNLGRVFHYLGEHQTAIDYFEVALSIAKKISDTSSEGAWLRHLGNVSGDLEQYPFMLDYDQRSLNISGDSIHSLINLYHGPRRYETAIKFLNESLEIAKRNRDRRDESNCLGKLGKMYYRLGEYERASNYHEQALAISREIGAQQDLGELLANKGNILRDVKNYLEAEACYRLALALTQEAPEIQWHIQYAWGDLCMLQQQDEQAFEHYQAAINIVEELRRGVTVELRAKFWQEKPPLYKQMVLCCLRQGKLWSALAYTELIKARYLADCISTRDSDKQPLSIDSTVALIEETLNRLPPATAIVVFTVIKTATIIFIVLKTTEGQLTNCCTPGWQQNGRLYVTSVPGFGEEALNQLLVKIDNTNEIQGGYLNDYYAYPDKWLDTLETTTHSLSEILFDTIWQQLDPLAIKRIVFIPNLGLSLLPLHACYITTDPGRVYCSERYEVTYAPSFQMLHYCQTNHLNGAGQPARLLAISSPSGNLPGAEMEVAIIKNYFRETKVLEKSSPNQATIESVLNNAPYYNYIHFAGTGEYDLARPLQSVLKLAPPDLLTVNTIFSQKLQLTTTQLVVLSANETGLISPNDMADEFINLPAGFLMAKVPIVISTLWRVDDLASALVMSQFYRNLQANLTCAAALRKAQTWLRNASCGDIEAYLSICYREHQGQTQAILFDYMRRYQILARQEPTRKPFAHPYYWAAFVVTGAGL